MNEPGRLIPAEDKKDFAEKAKVYMVYSGAFFDVYLKGKKDMQGILHGKSSDFVARMEYRD